MIGFIRRSLDGGKTWGKEEKMKTEKKGIIGPAKNPPIILPNGAIISGATRNGESYIELSRDNGFTWKKFPDISWSRDSFIQPSLLRWDDGFMRMVSCTDFGLSKLSGREVQGWKRMGPGLL